MCCHTDDPPALKSRSQRLQLQQSTQEGTVPLLLQSSLLGVTRRWSGCCTHRVHTNDVPKASIMTSLRRMNAINIDRPDVTQWPSIISNRLCKVSQCQMNLICGTGQIWGSEIINLRFKHPHLSSKGPSALFSLICRPNLCYAFTGKTWLLNCLSLL